ncbi:MAG: SDR family NAD(P)-dependent oxidoreductase [Burkholderiaceae bacterium]
MNFALRDKTVLITGAAGGIGRALALAFAEQGTRLMLLDRAQAPLLELSEQLSGITEVRSAVCDLGDNGAVASVAADLHAGWGRLDVLVNNAGAEYPTPITDDGPQATAAWAHLLDNNVVSMVRLTRALLPLMPQGACVINQSSIWGKTGVAGFSAYSASKHAIVGLTRSLAMELARAASGSTRCVRAGSAPRRPYARLTSRRRNRAAPLTTWSARSFRARRCRPCWHRPTSRACFSSGERRGGLAERPVSLGQPWRGDAVNAALFSLSGRTALVTGAATGIGRATALRLAQAGARVVVNHLDDADAARAVVDEIAAQGGQALAVQADVARADEVQRLVAQASALGAIEVLVNNAGIIQEKPFLQTTEADWDRMLTTDLKSVFLVSQAVLPGMQALGRGVIVNIASDLGILGRAQYAPYCAAKAGVIGLTRALAREFAPAIRVNAIAPGPVNTRMVSLDSMSAASIEKELDIPQHRFAEPDEIAATALFLVSDASRFYCGQVLGPNGGSVMP